MKSNKIVLEGVSVEAVQAAFNRAREARRERALRDMRIERMMAALREDGLTSLIVHGSQDPAGVLDDVTREILGK